MRKIKEVLRLSHEAGLGRRGIFPLRWTSVRAGAHAVSRPTRYGAAALYRAGTDLGISQRLSIIFIGKSWDSLNRLF